MNKSKITIIIAVIILILISLGIYKSTEMIISRDEQISQLKARNDAMVFQYANDQRDIKALKFEITGLNQEVENLQIQNASNSLFINALESKVIMAEMEYQQAISYIGMAEWILERQGVAYVYVGRR